MYSLDFIHFIHKVTLILERKAPWISIIYIPDWPILSIKSQPIALGFTYSVCESLKIYYLILSIFRLEMEYLSCMIFILYSERTLWNLCGHGCIPIRLIFTLECYRWNMSQKDLFWASLVDLVLVVCKICTLHLSRGETTSIFYQFLIADVPLYFKCQITKRCIYFYDVLYIPPEIFVMSKRAHMTSADVF